MLKDHFRKHTLRGHLINSMSDSIDKVVKNNVCIGCGACAFISRGKIKMELNKFGEYEPKSLVQDLGKQTKKLTVQVCPSLSPDLNENFLGKTLYDDGQKFDEHIGYYINCYGAYVKSSKIRHNSTSGGFGTWLGLKLLDLGLIDGVIHAKSINPKRHKGALFSYGISGNAEEIKNGAKTRYHVMEMSEVLSKIKEGNKKYLFIGVPCFIKSLRRIQRLDNQIQKNIPFAASLVCGHYKSIHWTNSLAWAVGIQPKDLKEFQYRTKSEKIDPRAYVFRATSFSGVTIQKNSSKVIGGKFNAGAMMPNACNYCDDVVGETADITIGDAWLPRFDFNKSGTNLLIIRNTKLHEVILGGASKEEVILHKISHEDAIKSQSGGFRQRREGLSFRLSIAKKGNFWVPQKRIKAQQFKVSSLRKLIYRQRMKVSSISRMSFVKALKLDDYRIYSRALSRQFLYLRILEVASSFRKIITIRVKRLFLSLIKK